MFVHRTPQRLKDVPWKKTRAGGVASKNCISDDKSWNEKYVMHRCVMNRKA